MPRRIQPHSLEKLRILSEYLPIYLQATTPALERVYIDAFSGPGLNELPSGKILDGSPLIALKAAWQSKSATVTEFNQLIFIEREENTAEELKVNLASNREFIRGRRIQVINQDVNKALPAVMREINLRSPTFVFLDTDGIEPAWTTVESISRWRTELLINFPLGMSINRNIASPKVDEYFGSSEARDIWKTARPFWPLELREYYKKRLKALGYEYSPIDQLIRAVGGQQLYYLIHASKVEAGERIMSWVLKRAGADRQGKLGI